jgi:CheY-like chemotaxis protein
LSANDRTSLDVVRQLAELYSGRLELEDAEGLEVKLTLPALNQVAVLAVDDNLDTLQLLERYTIGTRYRIIGTRDAEQALILAQEVLPQAIILDIMMPQSDGWQVLGRLRQHPRTRHIPIIVCTVLTQERLARSLGAHMFVHKPVTRQALLDALNHLLQKQEPPN